MASMSSNPRSTHILVQSTSTDLMSLPNQSFSYLSLVVLLLIIFFAGLYLFDFTLREVNTEGGNADACRLHVRNIPRRANITEIWEVFKSFRAFIMHVKQPVNPWTKKNNGICYIDTVTKQAAQQAIGVFKNAKLEGRTLVVELSNDDHSTTGESDVPGNSLSGASVGTLLIKEETVALREGRLAWIGGVVKGFINAKLFGKSEEIQTPSKIPRESRQRVWICGLPLISESSLQEELGRFISPVSRNFKIVGKLYPVQWACFSLQPWCIVTFETAEDAVAAIDNLHGHYITIKSSDYLIALRWDRGLEES